MLFVPVELPGLAVPDAAVVELLTLVPDALAALVLEVDALVPVLAALVAGAAVELPAELELPLESVAAA